MLPVSQNRRIPVIQAGILFYIISCLQWKMAVIVHLHVVRDSPRSQTWTKLSH